MTNVFSILFGLFLTMSLTLYGPIGTGDAANGDNVFSMELCADGVVKTVVFAADGQSVDTTQDCPECLTCCKASGSKSDTPYGVTLAAALTQADASGPSCRIPHLKNHITLPALRGPPGAFLVDHGMRVTVQKAQTFRIIGSYSGGRPLLKDATA